MSFPLQISQVPFPNDWIRMKILTMEIIDFAIGPRGVVVAEPWEIRPVVMVSGQVEYKSPSFHFLFNISVSLQTSLELGQSCLSLNWLLSLV
jgi:hypothetical protein